MAADTHALPSQSFRRSRVGLAARALRHKLHALHALGTFWPAARRAGRLLARGRFREFAGKLFNETASVRACDTAPVRSGPPLFLAGHILRAGGYDHVVYALLKGLLEAGVNVHRDPRSVMRMELIPDHLRPSESPRNDEQVRLAATPPHLLHRFRPDRRTAVFTMWETDTLPTESVAALNQCGLVIVPSHWGADCFLANGVTAPIEVVPLGHEPETFHPDVSSPGAECSPLVERAGHFESPFVKDRGQKDWSLCVFGTAGALDEGGLRKNVQRVIEWFRRAFPTEPDVRLRVKITPSSPPVQTHADPRIDVVQRSLTPVELADWYRSLRVYVNGSFGEGFGLHLLEAMACGRPLISTAFGGACEFFDRSVGYEVAYRMVECRNAIYSGKWAEPDDGEMIARMRQVYHKPDEVRLLGLSASERASRLTWRRTAQRLADVLALHGFLPGNRKPGEEGD